MVKMKKVSIIVPIYNAEKTIKRCVDSLVGQSYQNLEIVLLNDGSKDQTDKIIKTYSDNRIKYISKKNTGIGSTRNLGIDSSTGDYIMFVDSDDYVELECVKKLVNKLEMDDCDLVISDYYIESSHTIEVHIPLEKTTSLKESPEMITKINLAPWNKLYKRVLFENSNRFPLNVKYEDAPVVIQALIDSSRIGFMKECLFHYVIEPSGETFTRDERIFDIIKICEMIEEKLDTVEYVNKTDLIVKILSYYLKNARFIKDKNLRDRFIDAVFDHLKEVDRGWRKTLYLKETSFLKRKVVTNKFLLKMLCNFRH